MNQTEFARKIGVSNNAVSKAIKEGRIRLNDKGELDKTALEDWYKNKTNQLRFRP